MTQDIDRTDSCPTAEQLGDHSDGRVVAGVGTHVASCPACQATVKAYRVLDMGVWRAIEPPASLAERIKQACGELSWDEEPNVDEVPGEPLPFLRRFSPGLRVALACAAAVVLLLTVARPLLRVGSDNSSALTARPSTQSPAEEQPEMADADGTEAASWTSYPRDGGNVLKADGSYSRVAADGVGHSSLSAVPPQLAPRTIIPSRVKHVWMVENLSAAQRVLHDNLPAATSCTVVVTGSDSSAFYNVFLSDHKLQSLVDRLAAAGFPLVSASVPQPGKESRVLMTGRTVRYDVEFVQGE